MQLAPSALHATAETLGGYLGWTPNELIIDGIVSLDGPRDRQIGMRLTGDGSNIQLWAIGGAEPETPEPAQDVPPLPSGHRWHTWVHIGSLEADQDPATVLHHAITDRLLPAFDTKPLYVGHRPWQEAFDSALSEVLADAEAATEADDQPTPTPEPAPQPQTEPPAKAAPTRSRRKPAAKPTTPAATTPAAETKAKPRTARKRTPAKPATSQPTTS